MDGTTIIDGTQIKVELKTLIEKIHVAPNAAAWFFDLVKVAVKKYGYEFEVIQSQMKGDPLF